MISLIDIIMIKDKRKYELREEIIYSSQSLVEDMKSIIDKIVRIYEIEEV